MVNEIAPKQTREITGVMVNNAGTIPIPVEEAKEYIKYLENKLGGKLINLVIDVDEETDEVDLNYTYNTYMPFERIRRITGYLTGTLDTWNDAKQAEEKDRVKHDTNVERI